MQCAETQQVQRDITAATQQPCLALQVAKLKAFEVAVLNIPPRKPGLKARKQQLTQTKGFAEQSLSEPSL